MPLNPRTSFQDLILTLHQYWAAKGCVILQPYDMEVGAGTFHPATTLRSVGPKPWAAAYVQPSRRPKDGRYGENPNRLQHYYQYQVIIKPSPPDLQEQYLGSLAAIGIDPKLHDIRFVEDDWESPTLGAWGLGWEVWCDGMEVSQFTYFQQVGGLDCFPVSGELTYGLERLAMYVQGVDNVYDLNFNGLEGPKKISYGDVFLQAEQEYSRYNFEHADTAILQKHFEDAEKECKALLDVGLKDEKHELGASRLRPVHQGLAHVQSARCPRRDLRHRTPGLYPARARSRQGLLRSLEQDGGRKGLMPELLIELFSEEIPARMQARAAEDLRSLITNGLVDAGLTYEGAQAHATPRRLVLSVEGLNPKAADMREERKGPRTDAPKPAIDGFLKSTGLKLDELTVQDDKKGKFYIATIKKPGRATTDVVAELLPDVIRKFPWPKSMRWGSGQLRWVRQLAFHRLHLRWRSRAFRDRRHSFGQHHAGPPLPQQQKNRSPPLRGLCPEAPQGQRHRRCRVCAPKPSAPKQRISLSPKASK